MLRVGDRELFLRTKYGRDGNALPERCLAFDDPASREPYWVLNPEANGNLRYVVKTDRNRLRQLSGSLNRLAKDPANSAIYGMEIR